MKKNNVYALLLVLFCSFLAFGQEKKSVSNEDLVNKVMKKFKKDKKAFELFRYYGVCYCVSKHFQLDTNLFDLEYMMDAGSIITLPRIFSQESIEKSLIDYQSQINFLRIENWRKRLFDCYEIYEKKAFWKHYKRFVSNKDNYNTENEEKITFMEDYVRCGEIDWRHIYLGEYDFEKQPCPEHKKDKKDKNK